MERTPKPPHNPWLIALAFGALTVLLVVSLPVTLETLFGNYSPVTAGIILSVWVVGAFVWGILYARAIKILLFYLFSPFRGLKTVWKEKRSAWAVLTEPVIESDWERLARRIKKWRAKRGTRAESRLPIGAIPMFCTSCGAKNPDEAQFCHRCGKPVYR